MLPLAPRHMLSIYANPMCVLAESRTHKEFFFAFCRCLSYGSPESWNLNVIYADVDEQLHTVLQLHSLCYQGVSGLVVRVSKSQLSGWRSILTAGHLQATMSNLLTYCCSSLLSLLPSTGREMSSSLRATGWRPSVADCGGGIMSAICCTEGPIVR